MVITFVNRKEEPSRRKRMKEPKAEKKILRKKKTEKMACLCENGTDPI